MKTYKKEHVCRNFLFKSLFCRNYCDQSKMHFAKLKEVYVLKEAECPLIKFYLCKTVGDICKTILIFFKIF